jgi:peptidoglycan/xylan/chitin deacetylase (PgdA/CDA1 family)
MPFSPLRPAAVLLCAALAPLPAAAQGCLESGRTIAVDVAQTPAIGAIDSRAAKAGPDNTFQPLALEDHEVVLTFDDGPEPQTTPLVLAALKSRCATATFFLLGRNAKKHPALVRRILAEGNTLGSHTWSHASLEKLPEAAATREIEDGQKAIRAALAGSARTSAGDGLFRFPNLAYTPALLAWLRERGTVAVSADIATRDWANPPGEQTLKSVLRQLERRHKGIILLHDSKPNTAALLPALLDALAAGGYRVARLQPAGAGD